MDGNEFMAKLLQNPLSDTDRMILKQYSLMAKTVASLFGPSCEAVVHSLEMDIEESAIEVINGYITGRSIGAPMTNLALDIVYESRETDKDLFGPYYSMSENGKPLRSVTQIIRGENDRMIGLICFNLDLSVSLYDLMTAYSLRVDALRPAKREVYPRSIQELISHMFQDALEKANVNFPNPSVDRNLFIIEILMERGIFNFKGAADIIAKELGVSRSSIYNYLRNIEEKRGSDVTE